MILTDDNFSTIVRAVQLGRGLYDNLTRYIRFQMSCLFGYIITFLGASWADQAHGLAIARTIGMVTLALFNLFFSIEAKDERGSAFSLDTFSDKTFVITTGLSFFLLVMSVLGPFQTILKTTRLSVRQWLISTAVALSIVVTAEIRKALRRRRIAARVISAPPEPLAG